jgi:hypothetical protein
MRQTSVSRQKKGGSMEKYKQKKLTITFSQAQTAKYLEIASRKTEAEVNADCLPSGVDIVIEVGSPFGVTAMVDGHDLGEVGFDFVEMGESKNAI